MNDIATEKSTETLKINWTKSIRKNGITKSVSVEEVENGFIVRISKYGRDETIKDSEYKNEDKTFVSFENPLKPNEMDDDKSEEGKDKEECCKDVKSKVRSALDSLADTSGGINI